MSTAVTNQMTAFNQTQTQIHMVDTSICWPLNLLEWFIISLIGLLS